MVALSVDVNCQLTLAWQTIAGDNFQVVSPPTVAGGVVYYGTGAGSQLLAFDALSGTQLWSSNTTIQGPIYGAPMVVNGRSSWGRGIISFTRLDCRSHPQRSVQTG
jgi:outer membrane protein assembly factor BamB